ncbi:MAG: tetratricopeptide repeat protein [Planctomycetaceae bacterium]|jgi:tetratricopeptide (TPR) repeat protein|nr:tetratricopeptide repeat protein [Planctomycetaceae bacterium]
MKNTIFLFFGLILMLLSLSFGTVPSLGQENEPELPKPAINSADADNPGMPWLDQATEEKLRAQNAVDFGKVIALCRQARKEGLSGENLVYCDQLRAAAQLQRGLILSQEVLSKPVDALPENWRELRTKILADLEESVTIIKNQVLPYLRIAQLNTVLPDGNSQRASEILDLALENVKSDPHSYLQVILLKISLEKDPVKREKLIAEQTQNSSNNTQFLLLHVLSLIELKRNDEALAQLQKILELEPDNLQALDAAFQLLLSRKEYEEALKILDTKEKKGRDDEVTLKQRIPLLAEMGKLTDVIALLDELRKKHPEEPRILFLRAEFYGQIKDYDKALKDIDAGIRLFPDHPMFLLQKIKIFVAKEQYDDALKIVDDFIKENPENIDFQLAKVQIFVAKKQFDDAITVIEELRTKYPDNNNKWTFLKIQVLSDAKKYDEALAILEEVRKKEPDKDTITLLMISIFSSQKKNRKALEILTPLLEKEPENLALLRIKSQILIALNRHYDAVKVLETITEKDPNDEVSSNNLSWILSTSPLESIRNGKRALELAEKAGQLTDYKKAYILSTLAAAYAEIGNFEKAVEWSQKSIEYAKDDENVSDRIEELQKELDSYKQKKPFREILPEEKE